MQFTKSCIDNYLYFEALSDEEAGKEIHKYEERTKEKLASEEITQLEAWDMFFALLHECDIRNMLEDRERILRNIDTENYNPFMSSNPGIIFIARIRARGLGLCKELNN